MNRVWRRVTELNQWLVGYWWHLGSKGKVSHTRYRALAPDVMPV